MNTKAITVHSIAQGIAKQDGFNKLITPIITGYMLTSKRDIFDYWDYYFSSHIKDVKGSFPHIIYKIDDKVCLELLFYQFAKDNSTKFRGKTCFMVWLLDDLILAQKDRLALENSLVTCRKAFHNYGKIVYI